VIFTMDKIIINGGNPNGVILNYRCRHCGDLIEMSTSLLPENARHTIIHICSRENIDSIKYGIADLVGWRAAERLFNDNR